MQKDRVSCTGGSLLVLCTSVLSTWAHNKNSKSKTMGRASKLSPFKQGRIVELHQQGRSCQDIAAELGRGKTAVNNFLRCPEAYGTKKSTGRPKKLSQRAKNAILRSAWQSSGLSARQIAAENSFDVSKDTISRCLKAEGFCRRKRLCRPRLLKRHKVRRLEFARNCFSWKERVEQDPVLGREEIQFGRTGRLPVLLGGPQHAQGDVLQASKRRWQHHGVERNWSKLQTRSPACPVLDECCPLPRNARPSQSGWWRQASVRRGVDFYAGQCPHSPCQFLQEIFWRAWIVKQRILGFGFEGLKSFRLFQKGFASPSL